MHIHANHGQPSSPPDQPPFAGYITASSAKQMGIKPLKLSGTEFRRRLRAGDQIPEWFTFKSVVDVLRSANRT